MLFLVTCGFSPQQEATDCDPLDELYEALAEVLGAEETTECYKSYLLVLNTLYITSTKPIYFVF